MSNLKRRKVNYGLIDSEPPSEKLISEGDLLIKKLAEKQRSTTVSLQEQLNKPKQFIRSFEITPLSQYSSGASSLSEIVASNQRFNCIEYLEAAGLSSEDVGLYLDSLNGFEFISDKRKNLEKDLLKERLELIQDLVEQYASSLEATPEPKISHTLNEHGLMIKPNSVETKLLKFALSNSRDLELNIPKPIDNIVEIEKNRFHPDEESVPSVTAIRRKARKLQKRVNNLKKDPQKIPNVTVLQSNSKWDIIESVVSEPPLERVEKKIYSCSPINYYTVRHNEIVKLNNFKEKPKVYTKLTLQQIKQIPKFKDFEPGNPSKVLYLKNLKNVKEEELKELFKDYDGSITEYKVMYGKLRGQAFISFLNEERASEALQEINGTMIKNKPVIIQFGIKR